MNIILKEELVLTWLVQQKTTDTIEQVSLLLLIQLQVQLINQQIQWYVVGQVTDKVLEKLIEDEDFVAGGQNSSNPIRSPRSHNFSNTLDFISVFSFLQRQVRSRRSLLHDAWADGEHRHEAWRLWWLITRWQTQIQILILVNK